MKERGRSTTADPAGGERYEEFTDRQEQFVRLVARGLSNDEAAEAMSITPRAAKFYCEVLRAKLQVATRREIPLAYMRLTGVDPYPRP